MGDVIDRDQLKWKLLGLKTRTQQRRQSDFRRGQIEALDFALIAADNCDALEVQTVTRCKDCRHASERCSTLPYCFIHARHKNPDDFCNYGERDE